MSLSTTNTDPNTHPDSYSDGRPNSYRYANGDCHGYSNSDRYANRDSNRDPLFDTRGANKSFRDCNLMQPDQTLVDGQCK